MRITPLAFMAKPARRALGRAIDKWVPIISDNEDGDEDEDGSEDGEGIADI